MDNSKKVAKHQGIVLFYKYFLAPLPQLNATDVEKTESTLQQLCYESSLKGRILLAKEGINGTLSGPDTGTLQAFCARLEEAEPLLHDIDWKFSDNASEKEPFPDLKIAIVREIVSTGNTITLDDIPQYGGNHLTPEEFHIALKGDGEKQTVVIDVRNTFEYNIGHFVPPEASFEETLVLNPEMVTFASFNGFCDKNAEYLKDKKVLMYCTGGIRCEKASAMLTKRGVEDVNQLQGGIHRYVEQFGDHGYFQGKNFVFDQRVALDASDNKQIVGQCIYCKTKFDKISGNRICTVCRDLVLVCDECQKTHREYHCKLHLDWKDCYFTFLEVYASDELKKQLSGLKVLAESDLSRNTKRTLRKQISKLEQRMKDLENGSAQIDRDAHRRCRTCREPDLICDGLCWGFWKAHSSTYAEISGTKSDGSLPTIQIGQKVKPGPDWNPIRLGAPKRYKSGIVIQVKSWSGEAQNCVVVVWDDEACSDRDDNEDSCRGVEIARSRANAQIYRFGVMAKDGKPKYDVVVDNGM
ncbi:unnamed protein product [Cylindrotheca closterium]|uniref:Rhodanese domain-containing protein n=1 Tax=Cylindrotheca closterium TaxID=2856 RepID=A0AAD2FC71_9STRA|nr:unnamed protein product [Cylindrotheca closterium]